MSNGIQPWTGIVRAVPCGRKDHNRPTPAMQYNPCIIDVAWVQFSSRHRFPVMDIDPRQRARSIGDFMRTSFDVVSESCLRGFSGGLFQEYCARRPFYVISASQLGTTSASADVDRRYVREVYAMMHGAVAVASIASEPGMSGGAVYRNNVLLGIVAKGVTIIARKETVLKETTYTVAVPIGLVCILWKDVCTPARGS